MPCTVALPGPGVLEGFRIRSDRMVDRQPPRTYRFAAMPQPCRDLGTDAPEMYSVYCRLCQLKQNADCAVKDRCAAQKERVELSMPTVPEFPALPTHDHLKCRCYENSLKIIRELEQSRVSTPVRCEKPRYVPDKLMNQVWTKYVLNEQTQLPLSTLVVRWQLRRDIPSYDMQELHTILSCYGHITAIYQQSPNSAMVIFDNISSACRVIQTKQLGKLRNKIHCSWWHRYMSNKSFYTTRKGLAVRMDPFLQLLN